LGLKISASLKTDKELSLLLLPATIANSTLITLLKAKITQQAQETTEKNLLLVVKRK
jgi:hypothetical protein